MPEPHAVDSLSTLRRHPLAYAMAGAVLLGSAALWAVAAQQGASENHGRLRRASPSTAPVADTMPVPSVSAVGFEELRPFSVATRSEALVQFPCSSCHQDPLAPRRPAEAVIRPMHVDIQLRHADASAMSCATCHRADDLDALTLPDGSPVGMNHAYQVCASCHFEQVQDWAGGAHGKRVGRWEGDRVVLNCTDCHDPHRPALEKRWPSTFPRIPRTAQGGTR